MNLFGFDSCFEKTVWGGLELAILVALNIMQEKQKLFDAVLDLRLFQKKKQMIQ